MEAGPPNPPIIWGIQTALSCCGRKEAVVSVKVKGVVVRHVSIKKVNVSEPTKRYRDGKDVIKTREAHSSLGQSLEDKMSSVQTVTGIELARS